MHAALLAYTFGMGLATAAVIAWAIAWVVGAVSVFRRGDLGVGAKILWLLVLLVVPIVGLFIYYIWQAAVPDRFR